MNYIQPNINANPVDFAFSQSSKLQEKPLSDVSFSDALEAAYKTEQKVEDKTENTNKEQIASENVESENADKNKSVEENEKLAKTEENSDSKKTEVAKKDETDSDSNEENLDEETDDSSKIINIASNQNPIFKNEKIDADEEVETKIEISEIKLTNNENISSENVAIEDSEVEIDVNKLNLSSKIAEQTENLVQNDNFEEKISDSQISQIQNNNVASSKGQKLEKKEKDDLLENISVHDLRTKKTESSEINELGKVKIASSKKVVEQTEKSDKTEKNDKTAKLSKENRVLNQNVQVAKKTVSQNELKVAYNQDSQDSMQFTMELAAKANANITSSSGQVAAANGSDFQQMLSNTIQHNAADFVKAGNIILKDNNQGTINLILKPESLGNVKISLSLSDKTISGQITVASKEAYDAFRENIESIKQAFTQSGFDTGSFDLNFSNQQNFAQSDGQNSNAFEHQNAIANAEKSYGEYVSSENEDVSAYEKSDGHSVNIVA